MTVALALTPPAPSPRQTAAKWPEGTLGEGEYRRENAQPVSKLHAVTPPLPITRRGICALLEWERGLGGTGARYGRRVCLTITTKYEILLSGSFRYFWKER